MDDLRVVGIGASAGGIEALFELVAGLDTGLDAAVLVVVHQAADGPTVLAELLDRRCPLTVTTARDGEPLTPGAVVVAPPNAHLQVADGHVVLSNGPKENGHRPGIDPLFRSLAFAAGPGATGVVLSGMLDDGAAGLLDIVRHGGTAVVQDTADALYDAMPAAALDQVPGAVVRSARDIGPVLAEIAGRPLLDGHRPSERLAYEVRVSRGEAPGILERDPPGPVVGMSCPDCSGPLFDLGGQDNPRFRCRTGHAWSPQSLGAAQDEAVERALYAALRALEDKVALSNRVARSAQATGSARVAEKSRRSAEEALRSATVLRRLLVGAGRAAARGAADDGAAHDSHDSHDQDGGAG
ncbi:chemotaxis protein CheB [Actinomycetospora sp. TBRC 11914]|uniref:chemotaxis protein CheB n=1 Tax=Actinomycetospora sp. TBRC 11914 TaxID=2729387 RepID=UPI00145DF270|nr:chemotaxis protein CheB [Actinomycetospora sp. TBRC 11914]NMO90699.1 chemotaxis protein CheB [Actinomycetospora sp. TBRC 11914]